MFSQIYKFYHIRILLRPFPDIRRTFYLCAGKIHRMKHINVVAAIITDTASDRIFATQRGYGEFKDKWEFPGGKIEPGETQQQALEREILEELDTRITVGPLLTTVEYDYPTFHLTMHCYLCTVASGSLTLKEHESARWLRPDELRTLDWLPADVAAVDALESLPYRQKT